jgi:hypothetical protein
MSAPKSSAVPEARPAPGACGKVFLPLQAEYCYFEQNVDEEMTAAVKYLASGLLLALLTFEEERSLGVMRPPTPAQSRH